MEPNSQVPSSQALGQRCNAYIPEDDRDGFNTAGDELKPLPEHNPVGLPPLCPFVTN